MKKFFEEYGFVILAAIVVILLIAIATPIGTLIRTNTSHIVESFGEKTTQKLDYAMREDQAKNVIEIAAKNVIEVAGKKLTIMENLGNDKYLVLAEYQSYDKGFNTEEKTSVYKNSTVDDYLSNEYYNKLPETIRNAIVEQNISQTEYSANAFEWNSNRYSFDSSKVIGSTPVGTRKVFLPSAKELLNVVNVNNQKEMETFLKDSNGNSYHMWLRDKFDSYALYANYYNRSLNYFYVSNTYISVRPAFVLDLSRVGYEKVK